MSPKIKGYLVGIALSLAGVALYIGLAFAEIISSFVPMIMAYLFYVGYNMFNKETKSTPFYIALSVVTLVETVFSLFMYAVALCARYDMTIADMFSLEELKSAFMQDGAVSLLFAVIGIAVVVYEIKRKEKIAAQRANM